MVTGQIERLCVWASFFLLIFQCLRIAAGKEIICFPSVSLRRFAWTDIQLGLNSSLQILIQHQSSQLTVVLSTHTVEKLYGRAQAVAKSGA